MAKTDIARRLTVGAELQQSGGADVRVWAPACRRMDLIIPGLPERVIEMSREGNDYFHAFDPDARHGERYWLRLDGDRLRPDPASRWQPDGPHEASAYVDPAAFAWTDADWPGLRKDGHVIYELHVGSFTREGTWRAAIAQLEELARIGITVIEMMPVAEFPGRFGWGYDGVDLYAPAHIYGTPDDLRAFVDRAHAVGVGVILDVVYNHLGPDGNYLAEFSEDYFTDKYKNDWGRAINFETSAPARAYFVENARYWIDEFHFDGLRLDATQDVKDEASKEHVIAEIVRTARGAAGKRSVLIVAENEPQETRIVRPPEQQGFDVDAVWNDDAHHTAVVALTRRREADHRDYQGSPQELISCARWGYLYQGQWYTWQKKRRGTAAIDLMPHSFVTYLENHDQVANSPFGRRLHQLAAPAQYRAMTALAPPGPVDTPAVPGAGIRFIETVSLLRGSPGRSRGSRAQGARRVSVTIPQPDRRARRAAAAGARGRQHVRLVEAGFRGACDTRAGLRASHRSAGAETQRPRALASRLFSARGGRARRQRLPASLHRLGARRSPAARQPGLRPGFHAGARTADRATARSPVASGLEQRGARVRRAGHAAVATGRAMAGAGRLRAVLHSRATAERMMDLVRRIDHPRDREDETIAAGERPPRREWLVTNGLGGYASGTVAGMLTRRYHGMLVASLPAPLGRMVLLNHLLERVRLPGRGVIWLGDQDEVAGPNAADQTQHLAEFRLELGLPVWVYRVDGFTMEKRVMMPHGQNTVHITYRVLEGDGTIRFNLRPSVHYRGYEASVDEAAPRIYTIAATGQQYELSAGSDLPVLRMRLLGTRAALTLDEKGASDIPYQMEETRGYQWKGSLWSPGYFRADAAAGESVSLIASAEPWDTVLALSPEVAAAAEMERRRRLIAIGAPPQADTFAAELMLAADQFIIRPAGRIEESARARAAGDEVRTVIAGYHWFTDWGRDTMISLEGLTLATRPSPRSRLHPAHVRALRPRWPHSQHVPRRAARRASITPPTRRCGSSMRSSATSIATGDDETLRKLLPMLARHHRASSARHAFRHPRRSRGRTVHAGRRRAIS